MINKKDTSRYDLLKNQFYLKSLSHNEEIEDSLRRLFLYVYKNTKITYIEFINEQILFDYINFQRSKGFKDVSFISAIRDIKNYIYFLKNIKKSEYTPKVNLSVNNYPLWLNLNSKNEMLN